MKANMPPTSLGERIHSLRWRQRLSCRALAAKAGVSASMISRVERGMEPEFKHVVSIAYALGITPAELLKGLNLKTDLETWRAEKASPQR